MLNNLYRRIVDNRLWVWGVVAMVLLGSVILGLRASFLWLLVLGAGAGALVLLNWPSIGLFALVVAALVGRVEISTGTAVVVNPVTLLVPAMLALWALDMVRKREWHIVPSRANLPLFLYLLAGLLSLLVGNALWDPAVPRTGSFAIVQIAQWAVFTFSAGAFWLTGNLIKDEVSLSRLTYVFFAVAGGLFVLLTALALPTRNIYDATLIYYIATVGIYHAPLIMLLTALTGGQLLFNKKLSGGWRLFLVVILAAVLLYAFYIDRDRASTWVGVVSALGILAWSRWPRLRWPVVTLVVILAITGVLSSAVYQFAGGDAEWEESGGSRLTLISRVIEVTMHNPITGLGPAAYRPYARVTPLQYGRALWFEPQISSHNNYVDLFAHGGLVGLGLFLWFAVEFTLICLRVRSRAIPSFQTGFAGGYVNGMLAAWGGSLVLMMFADWILPFVYNIGFPGFQASLLVWLFLGGVLVLEDMEETETSGDHGEMKVSVS
ncbi:MAG: O-antigen ligase family protein [Anaerolineae bacterium]|nr:O-antigen ligase family protein [Anaerolineae bacterium]